MARFMRAIQFGATKLGGPDKPGHDDERKENYRSDASMFPPSTVMTAAVVLVAVAR